MRALVIGKDMPRLVATKLLSALTPRAFVGPLAPIQLREIPAPALPAPDWAVARTRLCGLCGSDYKQVFMNGAFDNPMTAMISWPQVLGHEVVGVIDEVGPGVTQRRIGERVVLNPWLSCATRGLPLCEWCEEGDLAQCLNFGRGHAAPGIHSGNSATATGGFAPRVPAHESQWIPIPDEISDDAAVLADPFSVSLHAILRTPPPPGGTALVYGAGTLGLLAIAILRVLHPHVRVLAVARFEHQARLAEKFGAERVRAPSAGARDPRGGRGDVRRGDRAAVATACRCCSAAPTWSTTPCRRPRPSRWACGSRTSAAAIVALGVEPPRRFEWTPLYFKEIAIVGSNGFGIEEYDDRRQHAMEWYFEFLRTKRIDVTPIITHRFPLAALPRRVHDLLCARRARSGQGAVRPLRRDEESSR